MIQIFKLEQPETNAPFTADEIQGDLDRMGLIVTLVDATVVSATPPDDSERRSDGA
jgi:hypothetical protein